MSFDRTGAVKIFIAVSVAGAFFVAVFLLHKEKPAFDCGIGGKKEEVYNERSSKNFSCYAVYYSKITEMFGVRFALDDLKTRIKNDSYAKQECHLITHTIGRKAVAVTASVAETFALGEYICGGGYFHGVMEGVVLRQGKDISPKFLRDICGPFREKDQGGLSLLHVDCVHGLGHALMFMGNNELFGSLRSCELLGDQRESHHCFVGVFMENSISGTEDHPTKYLKTDDLMYPCNAVDEKYKGACYDFQTSYILRVTGSFEKMLSACREAPEQYQERCFISVGRDVAGSEEMDILRTKDRCFSLSSYKQEQESCLRAAVGVRIHYYNSRAEGKRFCAALPEEFKKKCFNDVQVYADGFMVI